MSADGDPLSIVLAVSPLYPGRLIPDEGKSVVSVDVDTCFFLLFREFFNLHPFVCLWNCSAILLVEYHA